MSEAVQWLINVNFEPRFYLNFWTQISTPPGTWLCWLYQSLLTSGISACAVGTGGRRARSRLLYQFCGHWESELPDRDPFLLVGFRCGGVQTAVSWLTRA